ncbi:hypothetical protein JYU34_000371 [Plutella xylostella]|uniref:Regulatory protein zeste n=1 Tax=Plutella xylostella TaxID=51655 RepID=A0ABQ7R7K6_PLUXY|nr:hypothetical protein JYU34_000371 [Plutella xylostella]
MEGLKRKRSPNWLPSERILLMDLVENHFLVIENKKTDGVSVKAKLAEWQTIATEYNSQTTHSHRDAENLKNQWESMKKAAKKEASHARMQRIQTGGGPSQQKKEDPVSSRIISLIGTSAVGLYNPYDKDSVVPVYADSQTSTATGSGSEYLPGSCNIGLD